MDDNKNEQLDGLVYGYLQRKGYQQTMDTLTRESPFFAALRKQAPPERMFINVDGRLKDKTLEQIVTEFAFTDQPKWHPSLVDIERRIKSASNELSNLINADSNQNVHFSQLSFCNCHQIIPNINSSNKVTLPQQATYPLAHIAELMPSCQPSNIPQNSRLAPGQNKAEIQLQPTQDLQENNMDTSIKSKDESRQVEVESRKVDEESEEQKTVTTDAVETNTLVEELKAVTTDAVEAILVEEENDEPKTNAVETNSLKQDGEVLHLTEKEGSPEEFIIVDDIPKLFEPPTPLLSPLPPRGLPSSQKSPFAESGINDILQETKESSRSDKPKQHDKKKSINVDSGIATPLKLGIKIESEILSKDKRNSLTEVATLSPLMGKREVAKKQEPNEKMCLAPRTRSQTVREHDKKPSQSQNRQQQGHGGSENGERRKQDLDEKRSLEKMLFQERQKEKAIKDRSSYNKQESFEIKRRHREDPRIDDWSRNAFDLSRKDERRGSGAYRKRHSTDIHPSDYLFRELDRSPSVTKVAKTHSNQALSDGRGKSMPQREKDFMERKSFVKNVPASYKQEFERANDSEPQGYNTSWASAKTERSMISPENCAPKDPRLETSSSKKSRAEDVTPQLNNVKQIFSNAVVQTPSIQFRLGQLNLQQRYANEGK